MKRLILLTVLLAGCAGASNPHDYNHNYDRYLNLTKPGEPLSAAVEQRAIERFMNFYTVFSAEIIEAGLRDLYAQDAYFRDGFREVVGLEEMFDYFVASTAGVDECRFVIEMPTVADGEYFFRWVMKLKLKRKPDEEIVAVGVSHVRFNLEGKVVFQQDYWDAGRLYERLPLIGSLVRWINRRI